jgi:hypothetical protein
MHKLGRPTEAGEQKLLVKWLKVRGVPFFSVPNEAAFIAGTSWGLSGQLKAMGLTKGAPDLVLIGMPDRYPVAVEMKRPGGRLSQAQRDMHDEMRFHGWAVVVAYGADDAIKQLEKLGF